jgi:hypothetical protein
MGLLLILPLLVSGYLVCMNHPYHFSRLHRYDGQLLYLLVAKLGLYCLLFAFFAWGGVVYLSRHHEWFEPQEYAASTLLTMGIANEADVAHYAFLLEVAILSFFIPVPWVLTARFLGFLKGKFTHFESASAYHRARLLIGTPLGELLFDSVSRTRQILMLTMNDRKVYIGLVDSLGEASEKESPQRTFSFLPTLSGYRDKDTLELELTTIYSDSDKISVVLREENVMTATPWNAARWEVFSSQRQEKTTESVRKSFRQRLKNQRSRICNQ